MIGRILIFPCGAENAIEVRDALRFSPHFDIYGAASGNDRSELLYPGDRLIRLPFVKDREFISELNRAIIKHGITIIIATHDTVMLELARQRERISAFIAGCDCRTAELCRYKDKLYSHFDGEDFIPQWTREKPSFPPPYFLKPRDGQGGIGCRLADKVPIDLIAGEIICEYLAGAEYTVDCFTDRHGRLLFSGIRTRGLVKMGIAFESRPFSSPAIEEIARKLNASLAFRGMWFFQVKMESLGNPKLLEISSRASTTMGLWRQRGVNLPLMTAYDAADKDVAVIRQDFSIRLERALRSIYAADISYSRVYVDYDDTLIVHERVNGDLMKFLYQCADDGKELCLLTRHDGDMTQELARRRICPQLFNNIIHLDRDADKSAVVGADSIYIDNMFHDREKVAAMGIPVFDVDAVPGLVRA